MLLEFPSVEDVAWELRALNSSASGKTVVRLQVLDNGDWWVHAGDSSSDFKEHGYCSQAEVPGCVGKKKKPQKFDSEEVARRLIEEVRKQYGDSTSNHTSDDN